MSAPRPIRETLSGQASLLAELAAQALEPHLERLGITFSTFELLTAVKAIGPGASQADVARRLGITPPSLTEAVRQAVKAGLVEQMANRKDARSKTLRLSSAGDKKLQEALHAVNQAEKIMVHGIDEDELRVALNVLQTASRKLAHGLAEI